MRRRDFLAGAPTLGAAATRRPNIVLILADDLGFSDLGCYGSEIPTPNLDRLARGGMRFTQFYNAARCCPTRASLLTGLYPHQAGVGHMGRDLGAPAYRGYLNDRCVTLAEALGAAGYRTLMSGKWHVGAERPHWPCDRGFDESFATLGGTSDYFRPRNLVRNAEPVKAGGDGYYLTDDFTSHAVGMVERNAGRSQPFFLYLAYTAPHFPLQAPEPAIARHRGRYRAGWDVLREQRYARMIRLGLVEQRWKLSPRPDGIPPWTAAADHDDWDRRMATYAAMVERFDTGVGRVLDSLTRTGADRNTLVLFLSDNGGCAETKADGSMVEAPWANASNTPFRYFKHWAYEGGISTPLIGAWPGVIRAGSVSHEPGHVIDVMPTLLDTAGASYPKERIPAEGRSLMQAFRGRAGESGRTLFWEHEGNRAVRRGRWKLVAGNGGPWELYDMQNDRTELTDLANFEPSRVRELAAAWDRWASRCGVVEWKPEWEKRFGIPL